MSKLRRSVSLFMAATVLLVSGCAQALLKPNAPEGSDYYIGYMEGLQVAESRSGQAGWGIGSYFGTLACCLIGVGVSSAARSSKVNPPPELLIGRSTEYVSGFSAAYQDRARQKREKAATAGLAMGMLSNLLVNSIILATVNQ